MSLFSEEQIAELEKLFNLKRIETLPVRDGRVSKDHDVWWRNQNGPQLVQVSLHWKNIIEHPSAYSIAEPLVSVSYLN